MSNRDRVGKALELAGTALGVYVDRRMTRRTPMGGNWKLGYAGANVGGDVGALIGVIFDHWRDVFSDELKTTGRNLAGETRDWRNKWAHNEAFSSNDTYRALDTIERLLVAIDASEASEVGRSKAEAQRATYESQARSATPKPEAMFAEPAAGLQPWREVIEPHDDVSRGKYELAEFAANLYQVAKGEGLAEYTEPVEFFRRTYLTNGLTNLLTQASQRVTGAGGAPVVNLQTNFGGGKTHSMIALYHLFSGLPPTGFPQEIQELLERAGVSGLPPISRAVVVGTQLSPGQPDFKPDGTEIRTLWGELAWQLGGDVAYDLVADADRTGTNPGAAFEEVLRLAAPCLILVDEWVAYARQMFNSAEVLLGGSFETQFTFAQTLADAAIAVPGALLVVSLPVSDDPARPDVVPIGSEAEVGGAAGQETARRLGNVIGRIETSWRPASAEESFEIVRRRLFQPIDVDKVKHRDATARAFGEFYRSQAADFPVESREPAYVERIKQAYPIHPELFARLYEDWSTLEGFQRTRGVLRLMAAVISALWSNLDQSPLILPANIPLDDTAVQAELTRSLDHAWQAIIDTDVDGDTSVPRVIDTEDRRLGRYGASRRAARTVFLASAPRTGSPNAGVDLPRVKLGAALPGEAVATYGDALGRLTDRSSYLYVEGARYWYGTRASVAKLARDLVERYLSTDRDEVHELIKRRVGELSRDRGDFAAVHVCPASPAEVPDIPECRLVILGPDTPYTSKDQGSQAVAAVTGLLENRGSGARQYRNMLLFLAPDTRRLGELERAAAEHLAWSEIHGRWEELGLDAYGRNQARSKQDDTGRAVELRVGETYRWALIPDQPDPTGPIEWEQQPCDGQGGLAERASRRLKQNGVFNLAYSAELLRVRLEGQLVSRWADGHVDVNTLWEDFARYVYLPRLRDVTVLIDTVASGPNSTTWQQHGFAVADSYDSDRYVELVAGARPAAVNGTTLLVRPDAAAAQIAEIPEPPGPAPGPEPGPGPGGHPPKPPGPDAKKRFWANLELDPERYQRSFATLANEIVTNLTAQYGTAIRITVDIEATNPEGFPDDVVRTVSENANTLKIPRDQHGFESS